MSDNGNDGDDEDDVEDEVDDEDDEATDSSGNDARLIFSRISRIPRSRLMKASRVHAFIMREFQTL